MKEMIQENYNRIRAEVRQIVADELQRIQSDPELQYLLQNKQRVAGEKGKSVALTVTDFLFCQLYFLLYITDGAFPFHYIQWCGCRRYHSDGFCHTEGRRVFGTDAATDFPVIPIPQKHVAGIFGRLPLHNHDANTHCPACSRVPRYYSRQSRFSLSLPVR